MREEINYIIIVFLSWRDLFLTYLEIYCLLFFSHAFPLKRSVVIFLVYNMFDKTISTLYTVFMISFIFYFFLIYCVEFEKQYFP